jgi:hypothetical protein
MSAELPRPIQTYVRRFVRRGRRLAVIRALGTGLLLACCWAVLACLADRFLKLPPGVRIVSLAVAASLLLAPLLRPLVRMLSRRLDWVGAARAIESASPAFGQRLSTVISQSLERTEYRGSAEMLDRLADDVARQAVQERPSRALRWAPALRPWAALALLLAAAATLALLIPSMAAGVLLRRFATPLAGVPPVTTTRIWLEPPPDSLLRGEPLAVRARVANLRDGALEIFTSSDGRAWSRLPMTALADAEFVFNFPALDQDLRFYIAGGDARTDEHLVTILRKPALAELRVRYDFPPYTGRAPLLTTVNDGQVEALVGTRLTLTLVSTDALREAVFTVGGSKPEKLALAPTSDPRTFHAELTVRRSIVADLSMTSAQGQSQRVERALSVRAHPDREPIARLLQPAGDLRLQPRDLLELQYQFMDDYGLVSAAILVQVNTQAATQLPLPSSGDARSRQGQYLLDLAALKVKVGDVVSLSASAQDGAGKRVIRDTRHVLVSPASVDPATHLFIAELRSALEHAAAFQKEVDDGAAAAEAARRPGADPMPQRLKVTRALGASADAALLLHQALLRACPHCPPAAGDALASAADTARVALWSAQRLAALDAEGSREPAVAQGLKDLAQAIRQLSSELKVLADGQQASAILADRGNLAPLREAPPSERLKEALRRAEQDLAAAVLALGLKPAESNLQDRLQRRAGAAADALRAARVIDFEPPSRQWAQAVLTGQPIPPPLADRLATASTIEALRPDGQPVRARDLQLASRAAARLASAPADHLDSVKPALEQFPAAIQAIQAEHRLLRESPAAAASDRHRPLRDAAAAARARFSQWAELRFEWPPATAPSTGAGPDEIALQSSADMSRHDLASARALDQRLAAPQEAAAELTRVLDTAQAIDTASTSQRAVADKTALARTEQDAAALETSQRQIAGSVPAPSAPNSRQQGLAAVQRSQEQLAALPQRLTAALGSAEALRQAAEMADRARRDAAAAPPASKPMAQRAAELAASAARDVQKRLAADAAHLAPGIAEQVRKDLLAYHPETSEATHAIAERLGPALTALQQSLRSDGPSDIETAAHAVRFALELAQSHLAAAQTRLLEKDPAVAARFYAHAAAQALALRPPDFPAARRHQESALQALNRAWLEQLRAAGYARLALAPTFRPLLRPSSPDPAAPPGRSAQGIIEMVPGVREWGFLPPRTPDAAAAPATESDPAGYQEALRLYFDALNKVGTAPAPPQPR